ncbi:LLM class flavin-dependent oxidoreductase [Pacificimonas sp. WHA3]|uniref:LLM class flavin-dependent oxidoreductase n=1 Tax=Pacificimonas pallii TaxID=2827236 RepID=A0ABS6SCJ1_9SPHN|nr:LLM class flavin-dependent oxidoreductase [Pacificimonas pallii]MBV7256041.1 LLM class flavin-dependent oxidoreductase [Pacificimonas pallii]
MIPFSVLDLSPIVEGSDAPTAFANSVRLAQTAEACGYHRYWLAEHHGMAGIASAATSVVIGHVAGATRRIRVGAGGIMLPNHAPLLIAEQFGTLDAMYPGRIDLGLGRAPGSDGVVASAMKRDLHAAAERFPDDVAELMSYFAGTGPVTAVPGDGADVPIWMLGSSLYGAQVAAHFGLPYAFASHFAPAHMVEAIRIYRERFQPSARLKRPYVMLAMNVIAADTDEEAQYLATSLLQAFVNMARGRPGRLPKPIEGYEKDLPADARARLAATLSASAIGGPDTVAKALSIFMAEHQPDELILAGNVHDFEKRVKSCEIAAEVRTSLSQAEAA